MKAETIRETTQRKFVINRTSINMKVMSVWSLSLWPKIDTEDTERDIQILRST